MRRRHDRRLPGRIARADGDAAAAQADGVLRPRGGGGDHPARADRRADGAPVSQSARGPRAGQLSASVARADSRAHARRAAVSGAVAADRDGRGGVHRRAGRRAAARDGVQAIGAADEADRGAAARRHGRSGGLPATPPSRSSRRSPRLRCTAFPSRTPRASRCSPTRARISRCTIPRRSTRRCSTTSRWGSTIPSTLVKDAQRRGVRFHPIDVQLSDWDCTVEADGAIRLGLRYVSGLREQVGRAIAQSRPSAFARVASPSRIGETGPTCQPTCPALSQMRVRRRIDARTDRQRRACSATSARITRAAFAPPARQRAGASAFASVDELVSRAGVRRDELVTLADIGALNSLGYDRRSALWQAERAVRPSGEMFDDVNHRAHRDHRERLHDVSHRAPLRKSSHRRHRLY